MAVLSSSMQPQICDTRPAMLVETGLALVLVSSIPSVQGRGDQAGGAEWALSWIRREKA